MFLNSSFDKKENKLDDYSVKDCAENICKKFRERVTEIINYKKREMIPLTQEENNHYNEQKICYICKENFCVYKDDKDYINRKKFKDHCHYTGELKGPAHSICNLNYKAQKEIPVIIHNDSNASHNAISNRI